MKQSMYFVIALSLLSACGVATNPFENCDIFGNCSKRCDSVWGCGDDSRDEDGCSIWGCGADEEPEESCGIWGCADESADEPECDFYGNCK